LNRLIVEPMREEFILWRCLHGGPLSAKNIDDPAPHPEISWPWARARNVPLLKKLVQTYGTCAIVAREGAEVVATLRFYPKALCEFGEGGAAFCLQQTYPAGPKDDLAARDLPSLQDMPDKTLFVHCLLVVSPKDEPDRYRRKGLATDLARELVRWAGQQGWDAIEATAYEEIPLLYAIAGVAGKRFWEKLGFRVVHSDTEPGMSGEILEAVRKDALAAGIPAENAASRYRMRFDLATR
jgi:ribosomal protein S18 acetylase RimI-like enzyme